MYQALQDYCENSHQTGLFLLDMPTGFGKTYHTLRVIHQQAMAHPEKKIFFMTNLKKNLPATELKAIFEEQGHGKEFEKRFLQIEPNGEFVTAEALQALSNEIPEDIQQLPVYQNLLHKLQLIERNQEYNMEIVREFRQEVERKEEPAFRYLIAQKLKAEYPTKHQRIQALKKQKEWKWLAKLYPSVFTSEKQIFFLSMDKFLCPHATIVEPSYTFLGNAITDGALIFVDEVDAAKDVILKKLIGDDDHKIIDIVQLFTSLHGNLEAKHFPRAMTSASDGQEVPALVRALQELKKISADIYEKYQLQYNYKMQIPGEISKNFLFRDHLTHTLAQGNIAIEQSEHDRVNYIKLSKHTERDSAQSLAAMMGNMKGFFKKFSLTVAALANNYAAKKGKGEDEFTREEAVSTILSQFNLTDKQRQYLLVAVMNHATIQENQYDLSFYENGFEYYAFEDDTQHDMHSEMSMYQYHVTPEKIMLSLCQRAKVIGISATATLPGVIGNFDVRYLKEMLGDHYHTLDLQAQARIAEQFSKAIAGYDHLKIETTFLNKAFEGQYGIDSVKQIFCDQELAQDVYEKLNQKCGVNSYFKERYLRIFLAYHAFVHTKQIQAFLCLLTKFPKEGDDTLDRALLDKVFAYIKSECTQTEMEELQDEVLVLSGTEFDNKKEQMLQRLAQGQKLFVISTYQTLGAGQNIQYTVKDDSRYIRVNDFHQRLEKDFDAIYLDTPTHIISEIEVEQRFSSLIQRIYQIKYLEENAEISSKVAVKEIKASFRRFAQPLRYVESNLPKDTVSKNMAVTKIIMQAIGRICRTNVKNETIYIFAAPALQKILQESKIQNRLLNPEFLALLAQGKKDEMSLQSDAEQKAMLVSERANAYILSVLQYGFTEQKRAFWQILRLLVLQYPTLRKAQLDALERENPMYATLIKNFYIALDKPANKIWYQQTDDYQQVEVSFYTVLEQSVCAEAAKIDRLMAIPEIKEYFASKGYAKSFAQGDYILSPVLFNNIYKGAVGEAVGALFFEKHLGIQLEELTELETFEFFDFKIAKSAIYIDFKHWHKSMHVEKQAMHDKIFKKLKACKGKLAVVANIMEEAEFSAHKTEKDGLCILEIPSLYTDELSVNETTLAELWRTINEYRY